MARCLGLMAAVAAVTLLQGNPVAEARPHVEDIQRPLKTFGYGSCNDQSLPQPLWKTILKHDLDLWLWMGDNIYADMERGGKVSYPRHPATPETIRRLYKKLETQPEYAQLVEKTPMLAIWDDHDFGQNDAGKHYPYREESQQIFLDFMDEPKNSQRRKQQGIYASYVVGTGDRTVKFILLDNRYHRDDYGTENGEILGETQWQWLESELTNTTAAFNVIVSGVQIMPDDRVAGAESWSKFPKQRQRLLGLILRSQAKGIVLLSGDVHFAELNRLHCGSTTLTETTTSGMTHSWMQFHAGVISPLPSILFSFMNVLLPWEYRPTADSYYGYYNWGTMDIDWDHADHPVATLRIWGEDDHVKLEHQIASEVVGSKMTQEEAEEQVQSCVPTRQMHDFPRRLRQAAAMFVLIMLIVMLLISLFVLVFVAPYLAVKHIVQFATGNKSKAE